MKNKALSGKAAALRAAFPHTIPILSGFLFLGATYGVLMTSRGFHPLLAILMSVFVFAGSMQFIAVEIFLAAFDPLLAALMTLMVNARHLFYGISMQEKYRGLGLKKAYLIFGLCDETFSLNLSKDPPAGVDRGDFMLSITALDHIYWILGTAIGVLFGRLVPENIIGIDFSMTALFLIILLECVRKNRRNLLLASVGIAVSVISLLIFGKESFMIPSMIGIVVILLLIKPLIDKTEKEVEA